MTDRFSELLSELGSIFQMSLSQDRYNACSIQIPPITIQMELDGSGENLILFAKIIEIPPGKFRENVLTEALKANALADPRTGIFGYIANTNHLALHQTYPLELLSGEKLSGLFGAFYETAESWHSAIQSGQSMPSNAGKPLPFGIKP